MTSREVEKTEKREASTYCFCPKCNCCGWLRFPTDLHFLSPSHSFLFSVVGEDSTTLSEQHNKPSNTHKKMSVLEDCNHKHHQEWRYYQKAVFLPSSFQSLLLPTSQIMYQWPHHGENINQILVNTKTRGYTLFIYSHRLSYTSGFTPEKKLRMRTVIGFPSWKGNFYFYFYLSKCLLHSFIDRGQLHATKGTTALKDERN